MKKTIVEVIRDGTVSAKLPRVSGWPVRTEVVLYVLDEQNCSVDFHYTTNAMTDQLASDLFGLSLTHAISEVRVSDNRSCTRYESIEVQLSVRPSRSYQTNITSDVVAELVELLMEGSLK